jgi:DnaJ-class molecular chaperone
MSACPYGVLGVDRSADTAEIKRAFRLLAQQYHPDRHQEGERAQAEERFKTISAAYEILSDTERRAAHDAEQLQLDDPFAGLWGEALSNIFGAFRSRPRSTESPEPHTAPRRSPRGAHLKRELLVPFLVAVKGGTVELDHGRARLDVRVPAGVQAGDKLRLPGQGEPGDPPGDLFLQVQVQPHPELTRVEGPAGASLDLVCDLKLTWFEVVIGGPVRIMTLWGPFSVRFLPLEPYEGLEYELAGYGIRLASGARGNLILRVRLVPPPASSPALQLALADLQTGSNPRANLERSLR